MKRLILAALALACVASPALADTLKTGQAPQNLTYCSADGGVNWTPCSGSGGGGGGGGDASAANQATQVTAANLTNTRLGDISSPATGSTNSRLALILAKQPAIGTAGAASADVLSLQGVSGGVPIDTVVKSTATDRGAIVGTTAVQLMASNTARRGFSVQVQSASASCYISGQATATADYHSLQIAPGTFYETSNTHVGTGAVSVICTAASTSVYAREW